MKTIARRLLIILCVSLPFVSCKTIRELTVITYNVAPEDPDNEGVDDYVRIAKMLDNHSPNIIALQNVDFTTGQEEGADAITVFGEYAFMESGFAANVYFDENAPGVGILTAVLPLENWQIPLPGTGGNPIALIHEYSDCVMVSAQFPNDPEDQLESIAIMDSVASIYAPLGKPIIVAGNMRFTDGTPQFERMSRNFALLNHNQLPTADIITPDRDTVGVCIDYIWAYVDPGITYRVYSSKTLFPVRRSGFRPVIVNFTCEMARRKR